MSRAVGDTRKQIMGLRERLSNSRRTRGRYIGFVLLAISLVSLVLTLQTGHLIFEITFLLSLFVGSFVLFYEVEKHIGLGTANAVVVSSLLNVSYFMDALELEQGITFLPGLTDADEVRTTVYSSAQHKAITMPALAGPLTHIYELRIGDLSKLDLPYLSRNLPKVIVDGLQLAQGAEISMNGREIEAVLRRPTFSAIYLERRLSALNGRIGCPLACSIAESVAKCSKKSVVYAGYEYSIPEETVKFRYILGPE